MWLEVQPKFYPLVCCYKVLFFLSLCVISQLLIICRASYSIEQEQLVRITATHGVSYRTENTNKFKGTLKIKIFSTFSWLIVVRSCCVSCSLKLGIFFRCLVDFIFIFVKEDSWDISWLIVKYICTVSRVKLNWKKLLFWNKYAQEIFWCN